MVVPSCVCSVATGPAQLNFKRRQPLLHLQHVLGNSVGRLVSAGKSDPEQIKDIGIFGHGHSS
jgi:hypothetical protein